MKLLLVIFSILFGIEVFSQTTFTNQACINKFLLSPAYAGFNGNIESFVGYRHQWTGIEGSPSSGLVNINSPINKNSGVGLLINNYQSGNFKNFTINPAFSYKARITEKMNISFGINFSVINRQLEISKVRSQGADPVLQDLSSLKSTVYDAGAGFLFNYNFLFTGFYVSNLIANEGKYSDTNIKYLRNRQYVFHASYLIKINDYIFEPTAIAELNTENTENIIYYDISLLLRYKRRFFLSLSFQNNNAFCVSTGGALNDKIILNYSYEFGISGIAGTSAGTHELTLGFLIKRNQTEIADDIFPVTEEHEYQIKSDHEIKKLKKDIKKVKSGFNKTISKYENRIKKLEMKNSNYSIDQNNLNLSEPIVLNNIKFAMNNDKLISSSHAELNKIIVKMLTNPETKIKISIYTTNFGSEIFMNELAEKRSKTIKNYLVEKGVPESRIFIYTKGNSKTEKIELQYNR